jgi:cleavage stimulation factor subunit 3
MRYIRTYNLARPYHSMDDEVKQLYAWKQLLEAENQNRERLSNEEHIKRVTFIYRHALIYLYHYPEIWYDLANVLDSEESIKVLKKGYMITKDTSLMYAIAQYYEKHKQHDKVIKQYENMINKCPNEMVFLNYMLYLYQSMNIMDVNRLFLRACKHDTCSYKIYLMLVNIHLYRRSFKNARLIYERGFHHYIDSKEFMDRYLQFLEHTGDINHMRVIHKIRIHKHSTMINWKEYLLFEYRHGTYEIIRNAEKEYKKVFNQVKSIGGYHGLIDAKSHWNEHPCNNIVLDCTLKSNDYKPPQRKSRSEDPTRKRKRESGPMTIYERRKLSKLMSTKNV